MDIFKMYRSRRKSYYFGFTIAALFGVCAFTSVKSDGEENPPVTVPVPVSTPSSTQRSILVLKISPNFSGGSNSGSADGDEFIRNLNKRLEGYKKRISEYDTSNTRTPGGDHPVRNSHYPYEYPYPPPNKGDLEYNTNAILYFIAISIVIVVIGVVSCLCINKSTCHRAVGEMTARANASNERTTTRRATGANRGSRVNSNLSVISGATTATSFSASPSVTNVNFSAGANSAPSSHYTNANFDDGIHIKVMHDLPPSYESLFPPTTENTSSNANTVSTVSATANENNIETAKT